MISGVSASDINTTDSEAVSTALQDIDSVDESTENLYDNYEVLSVSDDSTVQNDSDTENSRSDTTDTLNIIGSVEKEINFEEKNSNNNQELLSATNNDILSSGALQSLSINSASISSITVVIKWLMPLQVYPMGSSVDIPFTLDGSSYSVKAIKTNYDFIEVVTVSKTISGSFKPGDHKVICYDESATATVIKGSSNGISTSISGGYNYGSTGSYTYSGTVNGKVGSVTLAGYVYIYKDGSLWKTVSCNANGAFSYSWSATDLSVGSHTLTCYYGGNDYYNAYGSSSNRQGSKSITVSKGNPQITISRTVNTNIYPGKVTIVFTVKNLKGDALSDITLTPNGNKFTSSSISTDSSGKATFIITPLDAGNYSDWTVTTTATDSYNSVVSSAVPSFMIEQGSPTITVTSASVDYGSGTYSVMGTAKVGSNNVDTGTITLKQGSTVLGTASVSGGSWTVSNIDSTLVNPSSSAYTITANYESNDYYNAASGNGYLTVNKFTPNINIDSASIFYNQTDNAVIAGRVYKFDGDFYDGSIDLYVNGELVGSDITVSSNGYWSYTLSSTTNLAPSSTAYSVGIVWKGNNYTEAASSTENKYTVNKGITLAIPSADNIDYGRTEYVYVYVNNVMGDGYLSGMDVTLTGTGITGILTNTTDSNGLVTFAVAGLERGKYDDWKVSVVGNDYYSGRDINVRTFYVQFPLNVIITNITPNNSIYPEELIITGFTDADQIPNGNVSLIIGDKTYTGFFDSNGNFSASLIGVKPGTYTNITAKYNPTVDEFYYRGVEGTVSIKETGMMIC